MACHCDKVLQHTPVGRLPALGIDVLCCECIDQGHLDIVLFVPENSSELPLWLQDLVICSCFVDCFDVQAASISTLLDLIILTQSVQTESENKTRHHSRQSFSEGRVSVVILPALLPTHLVYINGKTKFYQVF